MAPSFADGHSKMYKPLALKKGDYVLEVGIGTGISLKHYPDFVKVEAIDYSEPMLVKARKKVEKGGRGGMRGGGKRFTPLIRMGLL